MASNSALFSKTPEIVISFCVISPLETPSTMVKEPVLSVSVITELFVKIPVEVKANDNATASLNNLINSDNYKDIKYGIKLCNKNIGFNGKFYTFPYFLTFLLKRYLKEKR